MLWIWRCFVSDGNCSNFTVFRFTLKRFTKFHWFTERFFVGRFALFDVRPCNMLRVCLSVWFWYVILVCYICSLQSLQHFTHPPPPSPTHPMNLYYLFFVKNLTFCLQWSLRWRLWQVLIVFFLMLHAVEQELYQRTSRSKSTRYVEDVMWHAH